MRSEACRNTYVGDMLTGAMISANDNCDRNVGQEEQLAQCPSAGAHSDKVTFSAERQISYPGKDG